ncbi:MAG: DUF5698 domain-containing protein [Cyclobacteriaceae bacterium]|jgi:uncharacterized protein YebE (UPF0316 family)|nr:DUF5698 domain-containing protein [Cyclobacteriaceae bacterium]
METEFLSNLGISDDLYRYVILPLLIFLARIADVSINTIRIIYVLGGRKAIATVMGFFESFIWLMAIRQIFQHLDNWVSYFAYPAGFAIGILVGMIIEERIAYGKVIVRIITRKDIVPLTSFLNEVDFRYTSLKGHGRNGAENVVFTVLERERLDDLLEFLHKSLPTAFYTVEKVNRASDDYALATARRSGILSWLRSVRRD